jgi:L-lactate dehydrogenase (cytochrome)
MLQILKDELVMGMRLIGAPTVADIKRSMIITKTLSTHTTAVPRDSLNDYVYVHDVYVIVFNQILKYL